MIIYLTVLGTILFLFIIALISNISSYFRNLSKYTDKKTRLCCLDISVQETMAKEKRNEMMTNELHNAICIAASNAINDTGIDLSNRELAAKVICVIYDSIDSMISKDLHEWLEGKVDKESYIKSLIDQSLVNIEKYYAKRAMNETRTVKGLASLLTDLLDGSSDDESE